MSRFGAPARTWTLLIAVLPCVCAAAILFASPAAAQTNGVIAGIVNDAQGGVLPGVRSSPAS
ncbi:MAG: hypothetical protein ACRD3C_23695 [Vicinamibacterales bacterium]